MNSDCQAAPRLDKVSSVSIVFMSLNQTVERVEMLRTLMFRSVAVLLAVGLQAAHAIAQDSPVVKLPSESKLVVKLDMEAMQKSGFGKKLIELVGERLMEEIGKRAGIDVPDTEDATGFLGFNPLEETRSIVIAVSDFEKPENGLLAVIAMKKSIGNIETLLPSVPGYAVKTVGEYTIHSGTPHENAQVHLVIHTCSEGNKTLVAGSTEELVTGQLARMDGKTASDAKAFEYKPCSGAMIDLHVMEIPVDRLGEGPQTVIATMVDKIAFHLIDDSEKLNISLDLTAVDEENAEQLDQMVQGIVPMLEGQVAGFTEGLQVKRDGTAVSVKAAMDSKEVVHLLSDQFDGAVGALEGMLGGNQPGGNQ